MNPSDRVEFIKNWIINYVNNMPSKATSLVVGVSGGIDSAVVSTISSMTGIKTFVLSMPIKQIKSQDDLSKLHCNWLAKKFQNAEYLNVNLDGVFSEFEKAVTTNKSEHAFANSRARLRMTTLYQVAGSNNGLVVGTGNKVEDFGVGFYTKYGDGGVDISPIADCSKTQVWEMGSYLGVDEKIINAAPTDGLWADGRNDEDQLGMSYK
ncbi:MAG: NAD(+) synthase [Pelagibacteraceae bacterium]